MDPHSQAPQHDEPTIGGHRPASLLRAAITSARSSAAGGTDTTAWDPPLPDELAELIPGYNITDIIGRGGMGAVYRAVQTSLDRQVAIKLLPAELGADPEFEARFRHEAKAMARLNHPAIVQIYDFGQTVVGHYFFVMEYVDGTDLHQLIRKGQLTAEGALNAVSQICDALEYAHTEGYVHRDIKPANIFLTSKGLIKVGDFGLAKLVENPDQASLSERMGLTMPGIAMGTPHYIAPEQLAANGKIDHRADIYSMGIMFYEMLTGEIPRGSVRPPSQRIDQLDPRIDGVVFKAMEADPAERYQSASALRLELDSIRITPLPASKKKGALKKRPATTSADPTPPAKKKNPALLAAAIALPLLLVVGAAALFSSKPTPPPPNLAETHASPQPAPASKPPAPSPSQPAPVPPASNVSPASAIPAAADTAGLTALLAAEPVFRPDPNFPKANRNIRLTPQHFVFLNDDGSVDSQYPLRLLSEDSLEFKYSTGLRAQVTFSESFRQFVRRHEGRDSEQPSYTFLFLGKPEALPIAEQIRLRETFSAPGKLEAIGSDLPGDFLALAQPFHDFIQLSVGGDAGGDRVTWAALRENGETVAYPSGANTAPSGVALIRNSREIGFFFIHRDGSLTVTGNSPQPPPDLRPAIDAIGGKEHALALHPDGTVTLWGLRYPEWKVPEEALKDVVSISASRYMAATVTADGALHFWGGEAPYRRVASPPDDPFVKTIGTWVGKTDPKVLSRSGKIYNADGAQATITDFASDIAYCGPVMFQGRDGSWQAIAKDIPLGNQLPTFSKGFLFTAFYSDKTAAAIRIVPAGGQSAAPTLTTASPTPSLPAVAAAPPPPRMGRLRTFGNVAIEKRLLPIPEPDDATDYVTCKPSWAGWQALRANGDLVMASPFKSERAPSTLRHIADHGITVRQAALHKDGRVTFWSDQLQSRIGELEKVRLFDAAHRFAAAVFENGSARIWNTIETEPATTHQPTSDQLGDVTKVVASNAGACFLRRDGSVLFCDEKTNRSGLFENQRYQDVVGSTNGFLGLTYDGKVVSFGNSDRLSVPGDLPPATAIRSGLRFAAIRKEDGTWMAWAMKGFEEVTKPVIEKIATLRDVVDLGIYVGEFNANLIWIENVSTPSAPVLTGTTPVPSTPVATPSTATPTDDPILKIETAFHDRFGPEVLEPHRAAVQRLDTQFVAALNRERAAAVSAGDLEAVLAWKTALERLEAGGGVPSTEELTAAKPAQPAPPKLLQFYDTYRTELAKLVTLRDAKFAPLLKIRSEALRALEVERTRAGDLDTAVRAKTARETPPSAETARPASSNSPAPTGAMLPPATPALAAQLARYRIDYSRAGTLKVAGTVRQGGPPVPAPQPTAAQATGVSFVAARYQSGSAWIAVKQDGTIITSSPSDGEPPPAAKKPRWLHAGVQMIAIDHDGKAHLWGRQNWQPAKELRHVIKAESGTDNAIALHSDGSISVWGPLYNNFQPDPAWLANAIDVAAGMSRAWVLKSDGTVLGWDKEGLLKGPEGDFRQMKDLVSIHGSHRLVVGLDHRGRFVNNKGPVPTPLGQIQRVVAGYMLDLGLNRDGRLFLDNHEQNAQRFSSAVAPALAARNVIAAAGAADGKEPNLNGFLAWIEGDELPQPPAGRLVVMGYHQDTINSTETDYPPSQVPPDEGIRAVAAQGRHGGAWLAWGDSGQPYHNRRAGWADSRPENVFKIASNFQTASLHRDGSLQFYRTPDTKGQPPTDLQGYLNLHINGYNAAALKRNGSVVLWSEDLAAEQTFHPDRQWLGDALQVEGGVSSLKSWWFLRRDGSVGRSDATKTLTSEAESAFPVPVQAIATTRGRACLALDLEGRILHRHRSEPPVGLPDPQRPRPIRQSPQRRSLRRRPAP
jgi:serine/threonine protein kinase